MVKMPTAFFNMFKNSKTSIIVSNILSFESLALISFLGLPFSEIRNINYYFLGSRSISISDILFFVIGSFLFASFLKKEGIKYVIRRIIRIWFILIPLLFTSLSLLYQQYHAVNNYNISLYQVCGLSGVMFFYFLFFTTIYQKQDKFFIYIFRFTSIYIVFFVLIYIFTLYFYKEYKIEYTIKHTNIEEVARSIGTEGKGRSIAEIGIDMFMYGEGTPALHFPFSNPNQAALFLVLILLLSSGTILAFKKYYLLYLSIPSMVLAIAQTGSRSIMYIFVWIWIVFILSLLLNKFLSGVFKQRAIIHLILGTSLAVILFFVTIDSQGMRSISLLRTSPHELIIGKNDAWRNQKWKDALKEQPTKEQPTIDVKESLHNIYLDIMFSGGKFALLSFIIFIFSLFYISLMLFLKNIRTQTSPIYISILLGMIVITIGLYANPLLHLRFIWAFWGLIAALFYIEVESPRLSSFKL